MTERTPVRLQRSRQKGARLTSPNGLPVVCVSRPSKWANPFPVPEYGRGDAVAKFAEYVTGREDEIRADLGGKNLACWCKPGEACHADVLLALAIEADKKR